MIYLVYKPIAFKHTFTTVFFKANNFKTSGDLNQSSCLKWFTCDYFINFKFNKKKKIFNFLANKTHSINDIINNKLNKQLK